MTNKNQPQPKIKNSEKKPKFYCLDMFPYPSGAALHVGHPKGYVATDIYTRYKRMKGFNVLHPFGWDAFGLPAENYAIKNNIHPSIAVKENIKRFKNQLKMIDLDYDWDREIDTTDPNYYKWTQWIFLQLFKHGLAYKSEIPINFCPSCKTGLANEEVVNGKCERCKTKVERKKLSQWMLKITKYADRLLEGLKDLDWPKPIIEMQKNWIGRSEGTEIQFDVIADSSSVIPAKAGIQEKIPKQVRNDNLSINVFTTRTDTLFGCTYVVLAPEHELVRKLKPNIKNWDEVEKYLIDSQNKSDLERTELQKEKTGKKLDGIKAINPINNKEVDVWVADYVLASYGTGAVMAVPAHDERDFEFAKKYRIEIIETIISQNQKSKIPEKNLSDLNGAGKNQNDNSKIGNAFVDYGYLINSDEFDGLDSKTAIQKITEKLKSMGKGDFKTTFKLRDWIFSRQHYWGEPIPVVFCPNCAKDSKSEIPAYRTGRRNPKSENKGNSSIKINNIDYAIIPVDEKDLPLELPEVENYKTTETGESPLANESDPIIKKWLYTKCPKCGGSAKRETDTMPNWAGSSWYYIAYALNQKSKIKNQKFENIFLQNKKEIDYWLPVDLYVGGAEHAVLHLLYARFWHKFLYDIKKVSTDEPFYKLINVGLVLSPDGGKLSKSEGKSINPDELVEKYGSDAFRLTEMFLGPFRKTAVWNTNGIIGMKRFLNRIEKVKLIDNDMSDMVDDILKKIINKINDDIESFEFNTAISSLMECLNEKERSFTKQEFEIFLKLLYPFAPKTSQKMWKKIGNKDNISNEKFPEFTGKITAEKSNVIVQINSRVRSKFETSEKDEKKIIKLAKGDEKIQVLIKNQNIIKEIIIYNKPQNSYLVNIVVK